MITVYKYCLPFYATSVALPHGAKPLHVAEQDQNIYLWAQVDTDQELLEDFSYALISTGFRIKYDLSIYRYLGTVHITDGERLVFHVYIRADPEMIA